MKWENVYIFISSTFNDMHAERDYLVKRVFPELRVWCNKRKLKMVDIDLRWGISEKDATENKRVVEVFLNNIDKCRPFFLCFMGQRRGWVPSMSDINEETIQKFPGIKEYIGKHSITELEIIHALIHPFEQTKSSVRHTLFYFRNPNYLENIENPDVKAVYVKNEESLQELQYFKNQIEKDYGVTNYDAIWNPQKYSYELSNVNGKDLSEGRLEQFHIEEQSLAEHILERLKAAVQNEFPDHFCEEAEKDELEIELEQQDTFLFNACDSYISRKEQEEEIYSYMQGREKRPFVLVANAGYGKTSLLANIIQKCDASSLVYRFVGISAGSSDVTTTLHSVAEEIYRKGWIEQEDWEVVDKDVLLEFPNMLNKLKKKPCYIILDAIDQWSHMGKTSLAWLPERIPSNVKLILSIKGGANPELFEKLKNKHVIFTFMEGLNSREEKIRLIQTYMSQFLKDIDEEQMETILSMEGSDNPLYLKIVLNELRIHGSFDTLLDVFGKNYGKNPEEAFSTLVERLEKEEFCTFLDSKIFTSYVLGIVANSLDGVEFSEWNFIFKTYIPECEGISAEEIQDAVYAMSKHLSLFMVIENGRLNYLYDSFRRVVKLRYQEQNREFHRILADIYERYCNPNGEGTYIQSKSVDMRYLLYHTMEITAERLRKLVTNAWYFYELLKKTSAIQVAALLTQSEEKYPEIRGAKVIALYLIQYASRLDDSPNLIFERLETSAVYGYQNDLTRELCRNAMEMELPYYRNILNNEPWYYEADKELKIYTKREDELLVTVVGDYMVFCDDDFFDWDFWDNNITESEKKSSLFEIQNLETGEIERQVQIPKSFHTIKTVGEHLEVCQSTYNYQDSKKELLEYEMFSIPAMEKVGHREELENIVPIEINDSNPEKELLSLDDLFGNTTEYKMQVGNLEWKFTLCKEENATYIFEGAIYEIKDDEKILKLQKTYSEEISRYFSQIQSFLVFDGYAYFLCEGACLWVIDENLEWKGTLQIRNTEAEAKSGITNNHKYNRLMHIYKNYLLIMDRNHMSFYDRENLHKKLRKKMPPKMRWGKLEPVLYKGRLYLHGYKLYAIDSNSMETYESYLPRTIVTDAFNRYRLSLGTGKTEDYILGVSLRYDEIKMYALKNMSEVFSTPIHINAQDITIQDFFFSQNRIGIAGIKSSDSIKELVILYFERDNKEPVEVWNLGEKENYITTKVWVVDNIPYLITKEKANNKGDYKLMIYDLDRKTAISSYTYDGQDECGYQGNSIIWKKEIVFVMESPWLRKVQNAYLMKFDPKDRQWERIELCQGTYIGNNNGFVFLQNEQNISVYSIAAKTKIGVLKTDINKKCENVFKKENIFVAVFKGGICKVFSASTYELIFEQNLKLGNAKVINCPNSNRICVLAQSQIYQIYDVENTRQLGERINEKIELQEKEMGSWSLEELFADD